MHARKCATHHVDDLLQREPELELQRLGLVEDGALQVVVLGHLELQICGIGTRQSSRYKKRVWLIDGPTRSLMSLRSLGPDHTPAMDKKGDGQCMRCPKALLYSPLRGESPNFQHESFLCREGPL